MADMNWRRWAACRETDPAVFYPARGDASHGAEAKAICNSCPVRRVCLDVNLGEKHGIWGGLSERQRREERRRRAATGRPGYHRLTDSQALELRAQADAGATFAELGRQFEVSHVTAREIARRDSYRWVSEENAS